MERMDTTRKESTELERTNGKASRALQAKAKANEYRLQAIDRAGARTAQTDPNPSMSASTGLQKNHSHKESKKPYSTLTH